MVIAPVWPDFAVTRAGHVSTGLSGSFRVVDRIMSDLDVIDPDKILLDLDAISRQGNQALYIIPAICCAKYDDIATAQFMLAGLASPYHEIVATAQGRQH